MRALLDINVLLALFDSDHTDHGTARRWLSDNIGTGWSSCAITQNGFVRILSQPRYPSPVSPVEAIDRLRRATETPHHDFWPSGISILDDSRIATDRLIGHRQVTDVYLLALAVENGGRFATFDATVPLTAVPEATADHLVVIGSL